MVRPPPGGHERLDGDRGRVRVAPRETLVGATTRRPRAAGARVRSARASPRRRRPTGRRLAMPGSPHAVVDGPSPMEPRRPARRTSAHEVPAAHAARVEAGRGRGGAGRALDVAQHRLAQRAGHRVPQRCVPRAPPRRPLARGGHRQGGPRRVVRIGPAAHGEAAAEGVLVGGEVVQRPRERARLGGRQQRGPARPRGRSRSPDAGADRCGVGIEPRGSVSRRASGVHNSPSGEGCRHPSAESLREIATVRP